MTAPRYRLPILCAVLLAATLAAAGGAAAGITVVDDLGRSVIIAAPARRVVSLAPSITESLFAIGAGDAVIGVTAYCNHPAEVAACARVGGMVNPNLEAIVGLRPDLIVVSMEGNLRDDFLKLTALGIPTFVTNPRTLEGIRLSLQQLGTLTGREERARAVAAALKMREDSLRATARGRGPRVLMLVSTQPLMVVGRNTFLNELMTAAGADNLALRVAGTYPTYSREAVLRDDPDVILMTTGALPGSTELTEVFPEWRGLTALRNGRFATVDADVVSRPGPRAVDGLQQLITIFRTASR